MGEAGAGRVQGAAVASSCAFVTILEIGENSSKPHSSSDITIISFEPMKKLDDAAAAIKQQVRISEAEGS